MRSDVHSAALRAAAKVAFSVAFLAGCSAETEPTENGGATNDVDSDGTTPGVAEQDISSKPKPKTPKTPKVTSTGCHEQKPSCDALIAAAFPTEGNYPGTKKNVSSEVQACCTELLTKPGDDGLGMTAHRWDCCANATPGAKIGMACTPWGPPVPPSMNRKKRVAPPDAWIARLARDSMMVEVA